MWARTCLYQGYIWLPKSKWQTVLLTCVEEEGSVFPTWDGRGCTETTEGKRDTSQSPLAVVVSSLTPQLSRAR